MKDKYDAIKNASDIICTYLSDNNEATGDAFYSLMQYLDSDTIVAWFVESYWAGDEDEILAYMGEEDGQIILDHYNKHCA